MLDKYFHTISTKLSVQSNQVVQVFQLFEAGNTIPFIARYRKEATGNLDEIKIEQIKDSIDYFKDLEKRKITVLNTLTELGKLSPELKLKIDLCNDITILEDIYLPYKPKKKTRYSVAIENGLEPLAKSIFVQDRKLNIASESDKFINEKVANREDALQGARDIMAEWIHDDIRSRDRIRQLFNKTGIISSKVIRGKNEEGIKYKDYFLFSESVQKCPSHRILAMRRGEKEGFLSLDISVEEEKALDILDNLFVLNDSDSGEQVQISITDSYKRLLKPSIELEMRMALKNKADEDAIEVFATNTRQLLLSPPLGQKNTLGIDPGFRTGCKLVVLDKQGKLIHETVIYPHPPQGEYQKSIETIKFLAEKYEIEAIAIGNGTAGKETEQLCRSIAFNKAIGIYSVNESGASIYSASTAAREEFPDRDITVRGAVSIGRRLMDPLSELVKIDPKSIGVGQYQHDVNQTKLKGKLDFVVESCVNAVGVELNIASKHLLNYVAGLGPTVAKNIVDYREANGDFKNRQELKKVPLLGNKAFEQCAGFLRIRNAENPLDNSAIHPEQYGLVEQIALDLKCDIDALIRDASLRKQIDIRKYMNEKQGLFTLQDILKELEKPGRDPRAEMKAFEYATGINSMEDLNTGMILPGIVTNITNFGAFVDIGVKQDGMVHISHLANKFIRDPNEAVKLQEHVMVKVLEVDVARKRIQLSIKEAL
ncbi:MAG: RNA-binding transcriptional accessory protein [Chitinophagales bacterium]|nr:RNA-binding transcriptional accessory protein [Chitinophagales bacterium]